MQFFPHKNHVEEERTIIFLEYKSGTAINLQENNDLLKISSH